MKKPLDPEVLAYWLALSPEKKKEIMRVCFWELSQIAALKRARTPGAVEALHKRLREQGFQKGNKFGKGRPKKHD